MTLIKVFALVIKVLTFVVAALWLAGSDELEMFLAFHSVMLLVYFVLREDFDL